MIDTEYANAYSEVLEILKYIPLRDYNKIPKNKIEVFEINANRNYSFNYNPEQTLEEQNVSKIARGIIAILFRDYWATETQREKIITKQKYDRIKLEEEKKAKYDIDIFKNRDNFKLKQNVKQDTNANEVSMVKYEESIFKRIINKIKEIFFR